MPIDPNIPLGAQAPQFDISKLADLVQFGKQQKSQNALKQILADPNSTDPSTGLPNTNAIRKIMGIDPNTGVKLLEESASLQQKQQQGKMEEMKIYQPILKDARDEMANELDPLVKEFGVDKAVEMFKPKYTERLKSLESLGVPANIRAQLPQEFNASVLSKITAGAISPEKRADLNEKDAAGKRADAKETEAERHNREVEERMAKAAEAAAGSGKFTPYTEADTKDDKGNVVPGRTLSFDSKTGKYFDAEGKPTTPGKISKVGSGSGGGMPRSGSAIAVKKYMDEHPEATSADIQKFMAKGTAMSAAQRSLEAGPIGLQLKSLGVATDHLNTLRDLNEAFKGGDEKTIARAKAAWQTEFGTPAPSNIDVAAQFVAPELLKAIEGSPGGVAERDELAAKFKGARGQSNVDGAIDTAFALMGGQLNGVRQQVVHVNKMMSDEEFDDMLPSAARDAMAKHATKRDKKDDGKPDGKADAADHSKKTDKELLSGLGL